MNKNIIRYKATIILMSISILCFIAFLITALIIRENNLEYIIYFVIAAIFFIISIISVFQYIKITNSDFYNKIFVNRRPKLLEKYKSNNNLNEYLIDIQIVDLSKQIEKLLSDFNSNELIHGKIFYKIGENIFNHNENSFDIFYLLNSNYFNSFDEKIEKENLNKYSNEINDFIYSQYNENSFINCTIIYQQTISTITQKDFYYNFAGIWDSYMENDRFVKNRYYNICGIDNKTHNVYFYKPLKTDEGTEADLGYYINKYLKLHVKNN